MGRLDMFTLRALLHDGGGGIPVIEEQEPAAQDFSDTTFNLRVASIFIIFAAGMLGGLPPLFSKMFHSPAHPLPRIMRSLSAGIILSLALVHIIPDAVLEMEGLGVLMGDHPYNAAGACAVFGALLMVLLESVIHFFIDKRTAAATKAAAAMAADEPGGTRKHVAEAREQHLAATAGNLMHDPHTHVCMGQSHMMLNGVAAPTTRDQVLAVLFELGCIFHSFIIGITLGVNTEAISVVRSLLIALCFHQFLEGVALGSFITRAQLGKWKGIMMVVLYALTCPVGTAIGIAISDSYDAQSIKAIAVQGVFNGVSGGMLLYIGLVQLIAEDFSRREVEDPAVQSTPSKHQHRMEPSNHQHGLEVAECGGQEHKVADQPGWLLAACHGALFVGAAVMAMLAIWA